MKIIKQIRFSKNDFIVDLENTSLKLTYKIENDKFIVDISNMNLINATKIAILCSTYCFIKDFKKKICWIVSDEETKRAISVLRLQNTEERIKERRNERIVLAS